MKWEVLKTEPMTAEDNMSSDYQKLLEGPSHPILRFYQWKHPAATYGYFTDPNTLITGLDLGRRPTGGGIIFHTHDLAFSIIIPSTHPAYTINTLDNYAYVNKKIIQALHTLDPNLNLSLFPSTEKRQHNFCWEGPTPYDIVLEGKKAVGAAQRRTRQGILHQGSICLTLPDEAFLNKHLFSQETIQAILKENHPFKMNPPELEAAIVRQFVEA